MYDSFPLAFPFFITRLLLHNKTVLDRDLDFFFFFFNFAFLNLFICICIYIYPTTFISWSHGLDLDFIISIIFLIRISALRGSGSIIWHQFIAYFLLMGRLRFTKFFEYLEYRLLSIVQKKKIILIIDTVRHSHVACML